MSVEPDGDGLFGYRMHQSDVSAAGCVANESAEALVDNKRTDKPRRAKVKLGGLDGEGL